MNDLLKRIKTNAMLSAALYALLGLVLLFWPELSASVLCLALGAVLLVCGAVDILVFLRTRDGSLYSALHLIVGIILAAVGLWLMARPTLVTVIIPRIVGVLICFHGFSDLGSALTLHKNGSSRFGAALALGVITLALGAVLVVRPFSAFATVTRLLGAFLLYDGISDLWITGQVSKAVRQAQQDAHARQDAVDVDFENVHDD